MPGIGDARLDSETVYVIKAAKRFLTTPKPIRHHVNCAISAIKVYVVVHSYPQPIETYGTRDKEKPLYQR
jgi:hypothetical protein